MGLMGHTGLGTLVVGSRVEGSGVAQGDEFGVAEEVALGPFGEFYFGFDFGAEPDVVGHFVGGDAFAPVARTSGRVRTSLARIGGTNTINYRYTV
jgi:hypothetical protein